MYLFYALVHPEKVLNETGGNGYGAADTDGPYLFADRRSVGVYVYHIASGKHTFADPVFDRFDGLIYRVSGINPQKGMNWKTYALCLLGTNAVMLFIGYLSCVFNLLERLILTASAVWKRHFPLIPSSAL